MSSTSRPPSKRGVERKTHILKVAVQIIGRDGLARLSMRTLAAEAKIPLGALSYYFDSKDQLIRDVFDEHLDRELRRVMRTVAVIDSVGSPDDLTQRLTAFVCEGLNSQDHALVAEYEFIVEASRRSEFASRSRTWQQSFRAQLHNVFERLGSQQPDADARLMTAILAGLEVDNLSLSPLDTSQTADIRHTIGRAVTLMSSSWSPPAGLTAGSDET